MNQFPHKQKVLKLLKNELFPEVSPLHLSIKVLLLHLISSFFVLLICPQFGFGILKNGHYGLTNLFMSVSHEFCMFACGALLTLSSSITIWSQLKITEKEYLLDNKWALNALLLVITSSFFWMFAPEIIIIDYAIWIAGTLCVSLGASEILSPENNH